MDIQNILNTLTSPISTFLLGLLFGGFAESQIKKIFSAGEEMIVDGVKTVINTENDPYKREILRNIIKIVAREFPDAKGNEKFQYVKKIACGVMPDWILSDDKFGNIIEEEYQNIKKDLENI